MNNIKVAIIQTHPIQHFCPQFASYAKLDSIDIHVVFETNKGLELYFDKQFNKEIKWEGIDLNSFEHSFLNKEMEVSTVLKKLNPDIVIVYGYVNLVQIKAMQWSKKNKKHVFYISDATAHRKQRFYVKLFKKIKYLNFFKKIDVILSVGDSNESLYRFFNVGNDKMVRTSFPVDVEKLNIKFGNKELISKTVKTQYNINDDTIVLTTIGKLESFKKQSDIIQMLYYLRNNKTRMLLFIVGSGKNEENLKKLVLKFELKNVVFTGFVNPEKLVDYLCATDIYVHPSSREAHSLSISEAIYLGCPVVLSDACGSYGPTDDVQPGKNGFVYKTGDVKDLSNKIQFLAENYSLRKEFSEASLKISKYNQKLAHGEALMSAINLVKYK